MALTGRSHISLGKPKGGNGWHWRFRKSEICLSGMLCSRVPCLSTDLEPFVGEVAIAVWEERNTYDRYTVAILEEDTCYSVGHLPREISKECFYFLKMGGAIKGPRLGFLLGGSAEGVQRIGSGDFGSHNS